MSGPFVPLNQDWMVAPVEQLPGGGDIHETIKFDPQGKILDAHTTVRLPGGFDVNMPWGQ
ncbi:MAG: hypothetical protein A2729_05200 [Candidatus Buchananbacteria bacterium RIFCSPHIGHO2_01_FULL_39_14]|uniref:Uncharacterized protein n=2 Tax=Candidatus Buchananiibacteriota TaxID=1817903 RepID=A0A1G1YQ62_9BACT|nr:MAG: hypothetical protein A2729_05200 [Candidatus Buchananbacteria bacterium RIFCSPHIGHO2_01_FULL_39_14]OGY48109.1 MAG: hypothetical protein A3D39_03575 [Candidatus Buchananbacteria bacterium RIFCSPHIGHO2_02_FULL_39_17]OGY54461.1 MAG: hypothetical protein A2912_05710 [Candidatus Buchananbacteria bacterium RIFCSPLOWO2_01_FULL_40_23b]